MAQIPPISRLAQEDFKDQSWISKLLQPLNQFMLSVITALNKGLTFGENFNALVKVATFVTPASGAFESFSFTTSIPKPVGLWVVKAVDDTTGQVLTAPVFAYWTFANGSVKIENISGLGVPNHTYSVTLIVIGG